MSKWTVFFLEVGVVLDSVLVRVSQTVFLPVVGLVEPSELKPGDLVGLNKDSYLVLSKLPAELRQVYLLLHSRSLEVGTHTHAVESLRYDARVKAMEIDEKPKEDYTDVGGLDKQITELVEAVVLPMTHKQQFEELGIKPPKGK